MAGAGLDAGALRTVPCVAGAGCQSVGGLFPVWPVRGGRGGGHLDAHALGCAYDRQTVHSTCGAHCAPHTGGWSRGAGVGEEDPGGFVPQ